MDQNGGDINYTGAAQAEPQRQEAVTQPSSSPEVQWKASEFIDHQKSVSWFMLLGLGAVIVSGIVYLITHDVLSAAVITLAAVAFAVFARQKPRTLTYSLLPGTIKVGQKSYSYEDFRTFSVVQEGALYSIFLEPVKRWLPPLTIYFAPEDGEKIFDILATHIPHEERELDPVERLMRRIRF